MSNTDFKTQELSQVKGLNGYRVDCIFTAGDKIGNYVSPGILDGIGAYQLNDTSVYLLAIASLAVDITILENENAMLLKPQ